MRSLACFRRIRTLAVQASNGTNTMDDRKALGKEIESLANEVNRIAMQTTYGGKKILNGKSKDDSSLFGKDQNGANKGQAGTDGTLTLQVGANKGDTISFTGKSFMFSKLGTVDANLVTATADTLFKTDANTGAISVNMEKLEYTGNGNKYVGNLITYMDQMISFVDGQRADLGALQNRLESSIRNQSNVAANEADARSRIRDADFAEESANLSQQSIIQQAAASMLMQANTRPQLGLSLLG